MILLATLCATMAFGQSPYKYLKLENSQIYFEKVYLVDSLKASEVEKLLFLKLPSMVVNLDKITDFIITAKINNIHIDFQKYGGKYYGVWERITFPFDAEVFITWKEGKYKVIASNMYLGGGSLSEDFTTKKDYTKLDTNSLLISAGQIIEQYLADLFLFKPEKMDW